MEHPLSESKLILLYMIHEKENIAETDLVDFVIYHMYMDYFTAQNCMDELEEQGLVVKIKSRTDDNFYYTLLPEGDEVVGMFRNRIPHSIREDIRTYAGDSLLRETPLMEATADIHMHDQDHFEVTCHIFDGDRSVMSFEMTADSEDGANSIRNRWLQKGMNVYLNLLKELN
ncbi:MAG: DUF4364 family protein [Firmicutes bacterium]|nr:DUF4364 family protein [Bacillota bacterium]